VGDADDAAIVRCEAYAARPEACGVGEAHFPGGAGCEPVGAPCPAGDFAADLPAGAVYVLAGAPAGGDGSLAAPFADVASALASGAGTIALSKGTFDEAIVIVRAVTIRGACAAQTVLRAPTASEAEGTVRIGAAGVVLADLRVTGDRYGIEVEASADATLEGVAIEGAAVAGISAYAGGALVGERVLVRATRARPSDGLGGFGVEDYAGSSITLRWAVVEGNRHNGVWVENDGTTFDGADVAIVGTLPSDADGIFGIGLRADDGAQVTLARAAVLDNHAIGVLVETGATLVAEDLEVAGTMRDGSEFEFATGLVVSGGASAEVRRASFVGDVATEVIVDGASALLEDAVVADTLSMDSEDYGGGMTTLGGATLEVRRVDVARETFFGIGVGTGTELVATDLRVRDTPPTADGFGRGVAIAGDARVEIVRAALERNAERGILAYDRAEVSAEDLSIVDTVEVEGSELASGVGITALGGARIDLARAEISGGASAGLVLFGSALDATDLAIVDTKSAHSGDFLGCGLLAFEASTATLLRVRVEASRGWGVVAQDEGTIVAGEEISVVETAPNDCADCFAGGIGVAAAAGATVELTRFEVLDEALCGIQVATRGAIDLHHGVVAGNPIGATVADPEFEVARLQDDVVFRDNEQTLDSQALPMPGTETLR
jgi:hypothetical protein